ncbi:helix-turn-helix domain-containing protein [Rhizobium ruizarguesonis]|uniref:helix-turn-helix domain-containing protein n=1 Tax=Rhizobium ruizarguesonis TaxID=2081791 RepID=UPI001031C2A8|nr:AraC family transcriptional regulator [Rhizobium ruizarguesonis]TCB03008.1 AraC family transcriptional regulator [Rhizobium leguminosarum bv. viciae]TBD31907.1 AraC family transcriptional regulator [Rhizobium ruizarguesonis]TBD33111.1 AraC family transcriptional regulator [Rhizobium ruizarguesonis]TBD51935.1 AraC family transcriptional regulator [Rhizobium ruizarguesonis]TBD75339.1 AraC family transcriptional regulator [Rhizobium ruizarguesonis]
MQTDIAIKVSLGRIRDVFETIADCLHVEHFSVADPNISLAKLTRENGNRAITTSLGSGVGTFVVAARDSELRLEQKGRVLFHGLMIEDSVTFVEGPDPIAVELQSDACLYVLTFLRAPYRGPCSVVGGRFNIRDIRLAELIGEISESSPARRSELTRDFSQLAFEHYRSLPRVHPLSAWRLSRVRRYAESRIDQRMSLEELADVAGFSRAHFAATFKAATSMSAHEFLLRMRIQAAARLLICTDLALVEIALQTGFQNQPHFTTVFKKITAVTPRKWRDSRRSAAVASSLKNVFHAAAVIEHLPANPEGFVPHDLH